MWHQLQVAAVAVYSSLAAQAGPGRLLPQRRVHHDATFHHRGALRAPRRSSYPPWSSPDTGSRNCRVLLTAQAPDSLGTVTTYPAFSSAATVAASPSRSGDRKVRTRLDACGPVAQGRQLETYRAAGFLWARKPDPEMETASLDAVAARHSHVLADAAAISAAPGRGQTSCVSRRRGLHCQDLPAGLLFDGALQPVTSARTSASSAKTRTIERP